MIWSYVTKWSMPIEAIQKEAIEYVDFIVHSQCLEKRAPIVQRKFVKKTVNIESSKIPDPYSPTGMSC